jgi:hypothetical protein
MSIDFAVKDVLHKLSVKFIHAFLPEAKKPYYLKAVHQPELDIHGIASKADVYNIATSPKVIEEGLTAAMELIYYLAADGYKIKTPLFTLKIKVPGEYDGSENRLAEGTFPRARLQTSANFRTYLEKNITVAFDGRDDAEGHIQMKKEKVKDKKIRCLQQSFVLLFSFFIFTFSFVNHPQNRHPEFGKKRHPFAQRAEGSPFGFHLNRPGLGRHTSQA